jgi:predicted transcriptional regulator
MNGKKVLRIGIAPRSYIRQRTIDVARGRPLAADEPRHWVSSFGSLARILSEDNMRLLETIREARPQSLTELAELSGRAKSNLSRTLHAMEHLGLVELRELEGGRKSPVVVYDALQVDYPLSRGEHAA